MTREELVQTIALSLRFVKFNPHIDDFFLELAEKALQVVESNAMEVIDRDKL